MLVYSLNVSSTLAQHCNKIAMGQSIVPAAYMCLLLHSQKSKVQPLVEINTLYFNPNYV